MIKTIKVKKQFDLPTLIAYVWENKLYPTYVKSAQGRFKFKFTPDGTMVLASENIGAFGRSIGHIDTKYEIEVEEEITEYTDFEAFVVITDKGTIKSINNYHNMRSVRGLLENYEVEQKVYALIENKLELIWEREGNASI